MLIALLNKQLSQFSFFFFFFLIHFFFKPLPQKYSNMGHGFTLTKMKIIDDLILREVNSKK